MEEFERFYKVEEKKKHLIYSYEHLNRKEELIGGTGHSLPEGSMDLNLFQANPAFSPIFLKLVASETEGGLNKCASTKIPSLAKAFPTWRAKPAPRE
ncbi:hypothetical protein Leryth_021407 [Lithospermum erythrorhizon]|nr:hypothetical protein Leryth_021407 [Lithospermum erythrorhizon]